jgi:hypothetical protein
MTTEHQADPDAVRVRALAMGMGEVVARSVVELDLATERLAAALSVAQDARDQLDAAVAYEAGLVRLAARLDDDALDAATLEAAGTAIEAIEEVFGIGPAPISEAS